MNDQPVPRLEFDSAALPPDRQFATWAGFMPTYEVVAPDAEAGFAVRSTSWTLGPLILNRSAVGPVAMRRTTDRIRTDNRDHYVVMLMTEGRWEAETDEGPMAVEAGDICLMDMTRPIATLSEGNASIMVLVPRLVLDAAVPPFDLHGLVVRSGPVQLLADYLRALVERMSELQAADAEPVGRATRDILAGVLGTVREREAAKPAVPLLTRAKQHIARNLTATLTAESITKALQVSRSSLFKAFSPFGGLGPYVLQQRLALAHEALAKPDEHRKVSEIGFAVGFKSSAHFSRAFRDAYGYTPGTLQEKSARHRPEVLPPGRDTASTYRGWTRRLR